MSRSSRSIVSGKRSLRSRTSVAPRRPPAIEPVRKSAAPLAEAAPGELPKVVLRIPDLGEAEPEVVELAAPPPKRQGIKLFLVAAALVVVAVILLRGGGKKQASNAAPEEMSPPAPSGAATAAPSPLPTWKEPIVSLPPVETTSPPQTASDGPMMPNQPEPPRDLDTSQQSSSSERYPELRMAELPPRVGDGRGQALPPPQVRLKGHIELQPMETSYDGPRSRPY